MSCGICLEKYGTKKIVHLDCGHSYHNKCLNMWIKSKLEEREIIIHCPDVGCETILPLNKTQQGQVSKINNSIFKCPLNTNDIKCDGIIRKKNLRCSKCRAYFCNNCLNVKHIGKCDKTLVNGVDIKQCPKCKCKIYKDGGCDHVYCTKCNTHFDWVTLSTDQEKWNYIPEQNNFQFEINNGQLNLNDGVIGRFILNNDIFELTNEDFTNDINGLNNEIFGENNDEQFVNQIFFNILLLL